MGGRNGAAFRASLGTAGDVLRRGWVRFVLLAVVAVLGVLAGMGVVRGALQVLIPAQRSFLLHHGQLTRRGVALLVAELTGLAFVMILVVSTAAALTTSVLTTSLLDGRGRLLTAARQGLRRTPVAVVTFAVGAAAVAALLVASGLLSAVGVLALLAHPVARRWRRWPRLRTLVVVAVPFGAAAVCATRWSLIMPAAVAGRGGPRRLLRRSAEAVQGRAGVVVATLAVAVAADAGVYLGVRAIAEALAGGSAPRTAASVAALTVIALPMIAATVLYERAAPPLEPAFVLDELEPRPWNEVVTRGTAHVLAVAVILGGLAIPVFSTGPAQAQPLTPTTTTIIGYGPDQPHVGDAITVTVQVDHGATGTVTVDEGATQLGSASLVDNGFLTQAQVNIGSLSAGSHTVTAHYGGDSSFAPSTSGSTDIVVRPVSDVLNLSAAPNPGTYHQPVTITASVLTSSGTATGTVEFFQDATSLGAPVALDSTATATFTIASAEAGQFDYTAHYSGDGSHAALDTAAPYTEQVPSPTTLALAGPTGPVVYGNPVVVTATISSQLANPTGTVTFTDGATVLAASVPVASDQAQWKPDPNTLLPSTVNVTATYSGDPLNLGSSAGPLAVQVVAAATTTALTKTPAGSTAYGTAVALDATVAASGTPADVGTGTVQFWADGTKLDEIGVDATGHASLTVSTVGAGTHTDTAVYVPADGRFTTSTSSGVNGDVTAAVVTLGLSASPSSVAIGGASTLTATVTGTPAPTGSVTFTDGSATLGSASVAAGSASISPTFTAAGLHTITASFDGGTNFTMPTATATVDVGKLAPTIAINPSSTTLFAGQSVSFTVVATASGATPTGAVTVSDGSTVLGTGTLDPSGRFTVDVPAGLAVGTHTISAAYAGDSVVAAGSATLSYAVSPVPTAAAVTVNGPVSYGAGMAVTVAVHGLRSTPLVPTGTVHVYRTGDVLLGSLTLDSSGSASGTVTAPPAGANDVYAVYPGDDSFAESPPSPTVGVVVAKGTPVVTLAAPSPAPNDTTVQTTLRATVLGVDGVTPGTGSIDFTAGGADLGTAAVDGNGTATLVTTLPAGTFDVRAGYAGDTNFDGALSAARTLTVAKALPAVTLTARPSSLGQPLTLDATVASANSVPSVTGSVTFFDGAAAQGTVSRTAPTGLATYTITLPAPSLGTHTYRAVFSGDAAYLTNAATLDRDAGASPVLLLLGVITPGTVGTPTVVEASAQAPAGAPIPVGTVAFSDITGGRPGVPLGSVMIGPPLAAAEFRTTALGAGDHTILATFTPSTSTLQSAEATAVVTRLKNDATVAIGTPAAVHAVEPTTISSTAAPVDSTAPLPLGGTTTISTPDAGSCTFTGAVGSCPLTFPTAGIIETITSSWTGDPAFNAVSTTRQVLVTRLPSAIAAVATPATGWTAGVPFAVSWNAHSVGGVIPAPDAPVHVSAANGRPLCSGTTAVGSCQVTLANTDPAGLVVGYAGTTNWAPSTTTLDGGTLTACTPVLFRTTGFAGAVQADPASNCPGGWTAGTLLTVRAAPAAGAELRGWNITDNLGTRPLAPAADGSATIRVGTTPITVEAVLGVICVPLTISSVGPMRVDHPGAPGVVTATAPNCGDEHPSWETIAPDGVFGVGAQRGWYLPGTPVTLEAQPNRDPDSTTAAPISYVLYNWCEQPVGNASPAPCTFDGSTDPPSVVRTPTFVRPVTGWTRTITLTTATVASAVFGPVCYPLTSTVTGAGAVATDKNPNCSRPGDPAGPGYSINTHLTLTATSTTPYTYPDWDATPQLAKPPGWTPANQPPLLDTVEPVARQVTIGRTGAALTTAFQTCHTLTTNVTGAYDGLAGSPPRSSVQANVSPDCKVTPNIEQRYAPGTPVDLAPLVNNASPAPALTDTDVRELFGWQGDGQTVPPVAAAIASDRPCAAAPTTCVGDRVVTMDADRTVTAQLFRPNLCASYRFTVAPQDLPDPVLDHVRYVGGAVTPSCPTGKYPASEMPHLGRFTELFVKAARPAGFDGIVSWDTTVNLPTATPGQTTALDGVQCAPDDRSSVLVQRDPPTQQCWAAPDGSGYLLHTPAHSSVTASAYFCQGLTPTVTVLNILSQSRQDVAGSAAAGFFTEGGRACPNAPGAFLIGSSAGIRPTAPPAGFRFRGWTSLPPGATVDPTTNEAIIPLDGTTPTKPVHAVFELICVALHPDPANLTHVVDPPNCPDTPAADNLYIGGTPVTLLTDVPSNKAEATGWTNATPVADHLIAGVPYPQQATAYLDGETALGAGNPAAGTPVHANFRDYTSDEQFGRVVVNAVKKLVGVGTTVVQGFYDYFIPGKILGAVEGLVSGTLTLLANLGVPGAANASDVVSQTLSVPDNCLQCLARWGYGSVDTPPPVRDATLPSCAPPPPQTPVTATSNGTFVPFDPPPSSSPDGIVGIVESAARSALAQYKCAITLTTILGKGILAGRSLTTALDLQWRLGSDDPAIRSAAQAEEAAGAANTLKNVATRAIGPAITGGTNLYATSYGVDGGVGNPFANFGDFMSQCAQSFAIPQWAVDLADPPVSVSGVVTSPDAGGAVTVDGSGPYALTLGPFDTASLPATASTSDVAAALDALPNVARGDISVDGTPGAYTVRFSATASFPRGTELGVASGDAQVSNAPVRFEPVTAFNPGSENGVMAFTDATGHYTIDGLKNGPLTVVATPSLFRPRWFDGQSDESTATLVDFSRGPNPRADLTLTAYGLSRVSGRISTTSGTPLANATVRLFRAGTSTAMTQVTTDATGAYVAAAHTLPGDYRIRAEASGYQSRWYDGQPAPPAFAPYDGYALDIAVDGSGVPVTADLVLGPPQP